MTHDSSPKMMVMTHVCGVPVAVFRKHSGLLFASLQRDCEAIKESLDGIIAANTKMRVRGTDSVADALKILEECL